MNLESRILRSLVMAGVLALGAATTAGAAEYSFNFNDDPGDCTYTGSESPCYDPAFYVGEEFELTHQASNFDTGRIIWDPGYSGDGYYLSGHLTLAYSGEDSPYGYSGVMRFSSEVTTVQMRYVFTDNESPQPRYARLVPLYCDGESCTDGPAVPLPYTPPTEDDEDRYVTVTLPASGGPYNGVRVEATTAYSVHWTDLVLTVEDEEEDDPDHPRGITLSQSAPGQDTQIIDVPGFKSKANKVTKGGTVEADFCVARDLRERKPNNTFGYTPRAFKLKEAAKPTLAGEIDRGTCYGPIPDTYIEGNPLPVKTWQDLLGYVNLEIPAWSRSLKGTFHNLSDYWFVIGIVRTNAEFDGVVGALPSPEKLITYQQFPDSANNANDQLQNNGELKCNSPNVALRPLTFSGAVPAFHDFPNVEGNRMIPDTGQCDGQLTVTRKTTHVYPQRIDAALLPEVLNIETQIAGLAATLTQAYTCSNNAQRSFVTEMRAQLVTAQLNLLLRRYNPAVVNFENIAKIANRTSPTPVNFNNCVSENTNNGPRSNFKGAFISRALAAAFTVWDRFIPSQRNTTFQNPTWVQYMIPGMPTTPGTLAADVPYANQQTK